MFVLLLHQVKNPLIYIFFLVHFVYIRLEYLHFMAERDNSDIYFIYILKAQAYKLLPRDYDASASILDLSCFPGF